MKYQTNPELGPFINKWGCYFCCILEKVEKRGGVKFTNAEVVAIYEKSIAAGAVSQEVKDNPATAFDETDGCTVLIPPIVFNIAAMSKGLRIRCHGARKEAADFLPFSAEEEILELRRHDKPGSHFVSGTGKASKPGRPWQDEIEFDPIDGGSVAARVGYIASKRILTIRG